MEHYRDTIIKQITNHYENLTAVERKIADFFINNTELTDFSSKNISQKLYVSEASLSRFSQKSGFKGFRDFIYQYERSLKDTKININELTSKALSIYQDLLDQSFKLVNESQMDKIANLLSSCKHIYTFGMGSSGIAAEEFKLRFMRLGLIVENAQDNHRIKILASLADSDVFVIGFSVSGNTKEVIDGLKIAKEHGAKVLLITSNTSENLKTMCDEVLIIAKTKNLEFGTMVSPQFPILVMVDIFYTYFLNRDSKYKSDKYTKTLTALYNEV